jgi:hypothetical protein
VAIPLAASTRALLSCAFVLGLGVGCLGDLPRGPSCGDGWWDPKYEDCDPSSDDRSYLETCRKLGFGDRDAQCDPDTCELRASEMECKRCGDGIATADELCDGDDLRGASCPSGSGVLGCTQNCTLDHELCTPICGDGIVAGTEECEPSLPCGSDDDCEPGLVCNLMTNECIPGGGGIGPNLSCGFYETTAVGKEDKPYTSGDVARCTEHCTFGRNDCGFCGDGILDDEYDDRVYPEGDHATFPAELCDGEAQATARNDHCKMHCIDDDQWVSGDVVLVCAFECNEDCDGFVDPPHDADPVALGCCLNTGSPCPNDGFPGVPDLPCCGWLDNDDGLQQNLCVQGECP